MNLLYLIFFLFTLLISVSCNKGYQGLLVDAKDYQNTGAIAGDHVFATYTAMLSNMPVGLLMEDGKLVYICWPSEDLIDLACEVIRIEGQLQEASNIIIPERIWKKEDGEWILINISKSLK